MSCRSMRRAWILGPLLSLSVSLATCNGPVPAGNTTSPGGSKSGGGGGGGGGSGAAANTGSSSDPIIDLKPGPTSTSVSTGTGTEITDQTSCGVTTHSTTKMVADLLVIMDRSSSMEQAMDGNAPCEVGSTTCVQRWETTKTALKKVISSSGEDVNWGFKLFATPGKVDCTVSAGVEVPIAPGNASLIDAEINKAANAPGTGRTPTREGVIKGTAYLKTLTGPETKSILLATDGQPNCKGGTSAGGDDVEGTTAAIKAAFDAGFKVYVLGIGPDMSTETLNGFATAGGTAVTDIGGPGKNFYAALSGEDLAKHLNSIVGFVATCTLKLESKPDVPDNIAVEFDGDKSLRAPRDSTNGWEYASDTSIQLYGSWCDGFMNGTYKSVKVLFGCPGQVIP